MKSYNITLSGLLLCLPLIGLVGTGCAGSRYQRSTGVYVDDQALSAKVKTALFREPEVSGFDVNVNTFRGEVQLSGFVNSSMQKDRAAAVAREVPGVLMVVNNLEVKPAQKEAVGTPGTTVEGITRSAAEPSTTSRSASDLTPNSTPGRSSSENLLRDSAATSPLGVSAVPTASNVASDAAAISKGPGAHKVSIELSRGKATLSGHVTTESERDELQRRISEIPGVDSIENKIEVRPLAPVR